VIDSYSLAAADTAPWLRTGHDPLDRLLGPVNGRSGIAPGILHLFAGRLHHLSPILHRIATRALLPADQGRVGAPKVLYAVLDNYFDPYLLGEVGRQHGLVPSEVLSRVQVARAFTWDQAIENVARYIPAAAVPGTVVLYSGLTALYNPKDRDHQESLHELVAGIRKNMAAAPVYLVATAPMANGSVTKPSGGNNLYHLAGVLVAVRRERLDTGTTTIYHLVKHPALAEAEITTWEPAPDRRRAKKHGNVAKIASLDDFLPE
jgi:hypothetical protein